VSKIYAKIFINVVNNKNIFLYSIAYAALRRCYWSYGNSTVIYRRIMNTIHLYYEPLRYIHAQYVTKFRNIPLSFYCQLEVGDLHTEIDIHYLHVQFIADTLFLLDQERWIKR
jgi:hypothetical protein